MSNTVNAQSRSDFNQMQVMNLFSRRSQDRNTPLTTEERVTLLLGCIQLGKEHIANIQRGLTQGPIIFLGNTGSGKSTLINYLAGCEMDCVSPQSIGLNALNDVVIVKPGSRQPEVAKIGHSKSSETFMPDIVSVEGRYYCDCPGFLENRGVEINVANSLNIKHTIEASQRTRIVILTSYHSLAADKAESLRKTINIVKQFFGNQNNFRTHQGAILCGITHIPTRGPREEIPQRLENLKEWILSPGGLNQSARSFESDILSTLVQNLFIYDPLDRVEELKWDGGLKREEILRLIDSKQQITSSQNLFNVSLTSEDERELREICEDIDRKILDCLNRKEYNEVNHLFQKIRQIKQIGHPFLDRLFENSREKIVQYFKSFAQKMDQELVLNPRAWSPLATSALQTISNGLSSFRGEDQRYFSQSIDFDACKARHASHEAKVRFFEREKLIKTKTEQFIDKCSRYDIQNAETTLWDIKQEVNNINREFSHIGMCSEINVYSLDTQLMNAKARKTELDRVNNNSPGTLSIGGITMTSGGNTIRFGGLDFREIKITEQLASGNYNNISFNLLPGQSVNISGHNIEFQNNKNFRIDGVLLCSIQGNNVTLHGSIGV